MLQNIENIILELTNIRIEKEKLIAASYINKPQILFNVNNYDYFVATEPMILSEVKHEKSKDMIYFQIDNKDKNCFGRYIISNDNNNNPNTNYLLRPFTILKVENTNDLDLKKVVNLNYVKFSADNDKKFKKYIVNSMTYDIINNLNN